MKTEEKVLAKRVAMILKTERLRKMTTQADFAKKLGVGQGHLSKMEAAITLPSLTLWLNFCSMSGISTAAPMNENEFTRWKLKRRDR